MGEGESGLIKNGKHGGRKGSFNYQVTVLSAPVNLVVALAKPRRCTHRSFTKLHTERERQRQRETERERELSLIHI